MLVVIVGFWGKWVVLGFWIVFLGELIGLVEVVVDFSVLLVVVVEDLLLNI